MRVIFVIHCGVMHYCESTRQLRCQFAQIRNTSGSTNQIAQRSVILESDITARRILTIASNKVVVIIQSKLQIHLGEIHQFIVSTKLLCDGDCMLDIFAQSEKLIELTT